MDLIYLYEIPNFSLQKNIKSVLRDYVSNRNNGSKNLTKINIPVYNESFPIPTVVASQLYLSEKKDKELVEWLQNIPGGYRNSIIKIIFRNALSYPSTVPFEETGFINKEDPLLKDINKRKKKTKEQTLEDSRETAKEVLTAPLPVSNDNVQLKEAAPVLNEPAQEPEPKKQPFNPVKTTVSANPFAPVKSPFSQANGSNDSVDQDEESDDFFDRFEDMLNQG